MKRAKRNAAELEAITKFREKAKERKITLKELSVKLRLKNQEYIYNLLSIKERSRRLHIEDFVDLCIVLDISPNDALGFEGWEA